MIDEKLLELVRCPIDGQALRVAPSELTEALNQSIARAELRDHVDALVETPIDEALVSLDGSRAYPVRESIPTLIPGESIPIPAALRPLAQKTPGTPVGDETSAR